MQSTTRYWLGVASRDHVQRGVEGGFCQLCHGKRAPLARMQRGDWIVYYAPKQVFGGAEPCQQVVACGQVVDDQVYQYEMAPGFTPYRRNIRFVPDIRPVPLDKLRQLPDWRHIASRLRFGHVEISSSFFKQLAELMGVKAE